VFKGVIYYVLAYTVAAIYSNPNPTLSLTPTPNPNPKPYP